MPCPNGRAIPAVTQRQLEVLRVIHNFITTFGKSPTYREIGAAIGVKSTNAIYDFLLALSKKGALILCDGAARSLVVTQHGWDLLGVVRDTTVEDIRSVWIIRRTIPPADFEECMNQLLGVKEDDDAPKSPFMP